LAGHPVRGAAVLPDIDHPDGSVAYSFGFVTEGFAWLIEHVSGGHRHGTHSLAGIAAFTGAAYVAEHYRRTLGGRSGSGCCWSSSWRRGCGPGRLPAAALRPLARSAHRHRC
jgi:LexA-binding, inner membrane-associated putative hydrolase